MQLNPLRWWGIRHVRWYFKYQRVDHWVRAWGGLCMSASDQKYLDAVWRGKR
jgi:hypothetical protein